MENKYQFLETSGKGFFVGTHHNNIQTKIINKII